MQATGYPLLKLLGPKGDDPGFEQLQKVIDHLVQQEATRRKTSPNDLIRVVQDGQVVWMTAEEAEQLLAPVEDGEENRLRSHVESALKGETGILTLELKVMVAMGMATLDRYEEQKSIEANEVKRVRPRFIQLGRRVNATAAELREIEERIQEHRRENPIFDEFEGKMGQLLNLQRAGRSEEAAQIARQVAALRGKYLVLSRGLAANMNMIYDHRLDLQKTKKGILSTQRYVSAQREGTLKEQIEEHEKRLNYLCRGRSLEEALHGEKGNEISESALTLQTAESELRAVSTGLKVIELQEKEVEAVISHIAEHVLKEEKPPSKAEKPPTPDEPTPSERPSPPQKEGSKPRARRMAIMSQRR